MNRTLTKKLIIASIIFLAAFFYYSSRSLKIEKLVSPGQTTNTVSVTTSPEINISTSTNVSIEIEDTSSKKIVSSSIAIATSSELIGASAELVATSSKNIASPTLNKSTTTINIKVPFTTQAPLVNWSDPRQQDGCEEAVAIMAIAWVKNEGLSASSLISKSELEKIIIELSDFEQKNYGEYRDVNINDIATWIFNDYFKYNKVSVKSLKDEKDIIRELEAGSIVLLPMDGQKLKNPNFKAPGPVTHMILIKGYDYGTKEFITNDPGTRKGENYRYSEKIILEAIKVYPTGYHEELLEKSWKMLVVFK